VGDIAADPVGLQHFSECCRRQQELVVRDTHELPGGSSFQATAAAVTAMFDSVSAARRTLGQRLEATAVRVSAAAANFSATEDASESALDALADGTD
jgi:hypothetical protein